jgi:hypothetical protein
MMTADIKYGSFEGYPVRFTRYEAWQLVNGAWRKFGAPGEILTGAAVLTPAAFIAEFGDVPPLPAAAFQSSAENS